MYYKIIQDGKVIDVVYNPSFIRFLSSGHIAITDRSSAQGIIGSDNETIYSFSYKSDKATAIVKVYKISLNEFNRLSSLLNSERSINEEDDKLTKNQEIKIAELSKACQAKIIEGFSVRFTDANEYNFRLTAEDQINLLNLENQLNTGADTFIYHGTGLPCRIFTREEIKKIVNTYRKHVLYHTTYFNVAKQYIKSLNDINKINAFYYGKDITWFIKDYAVSQVLRNGGTI